MVGSRMRLHCGSQFEDHYKLLDRRLGSGSSGTVREAECRLTGKRAAVKIYDKAEMSARDHVNMQAELDLLASCRHAGIVKLECWYESSTLVHAVFEKLRGGDLFDRLEDEETGCSEEEVARIALQLLQVLAYLHGQQIVHRDIKLENVMLERENGGAIKLVDFGFATKMKTGQKVKGKYGSLQYIAPEVLAGKPYDERCDLFSLGSVLYALLTTEPLFQGEDESQIRRNNQSGEVDWSEAFLDLPPKVQDFVRRLLSADPASRPSATQALQHPWLRSHCRVSSVVEVTRGEGASETSQLITEKLKDRCKAMAQEFSDVADLACGDHAKVGGAAAMWRAIPANFNRRSDAPAGARRVGPRWAVDFCSWRS